MHASLTDKARETRIDLLEFYEGDYDAAFARLRHEDPVHWQPDAQMWIVTRHSDLKTVAADPAIYSSYYGVTVGSHAIAQQLYEAESHSDGDDRRWRLAELRHEIGTRSSAANVDNLQSMDPPHHARIRKIFQHSFTPGTLRSLESRVRQLTREVLSGIAPGQTGDFVELLAVPVPIYVIAELLGVAKEDRDDFRRWSDVVISAVEPKGDAEHARDLVQLEEMFAYFRTQVALRRSEPRDDLLTLMVQADVDGGPLPAPVVETLAKLILAAGNETTRSSIASTALALVEHPDQRTMLVRDPGLIPEAVNEFLRWTTPVRAFCRTATRTTMLGGHQIERGDFLALSYVSANRDAEAWQDPATFSVTRRVAPGHLTFGHGPHICLGQSLARLELTVVIEELLAHFPDYELAGDPVPTSSTMVNAIHSMPVLFR